MRCVIVGKGSGVRARRELHGFKLAWDERRSSLYHCSFREARLVLDCSLRNGSSSSRSYHNAYMKKHSVVTDGLLDFYLPCLVSQPPGPPSAQAALYPASPRGSPVPWGTRHSPLTLYQGETRRYNQEARKLLQHLSLSRVGRFHDQRKTTKSPAMQKPDTPAGQTFPS